MAATLTEPMGLPHAFASQNTSLPMDQDDSIQEDSRDSKSEEANQNESPINSYIADEESSDEDITVTFKSKKFRRKSAKHVMSDDSEDENVAPVLHLESNLMETEDDMDLQLEISENNDSDSDKSDIMMNRKQSKSKARKRSMKKVNNDSEDDGSVENVSRTTTRRRLDRDRQSQASSKGNAIQRLMKQRKKKKGEKLQDSDKEGNKSVENDAINRHLDPESESDTESENNSKKHRSQVIAEAGEAESDGDKNNEKDYELFEDSSSQSSVNEDNGSKKVPKRKTYGTRRKSALAKEVESDDDEERKAETMAIFANNPELFDAEGSDSGNDKNNNSDDGTEKRDGDKAENRRKKKSQKAEKLKKPSKAEKLATQSAQQKLWRDEKVHIPYHEPAAVSIQQFLGRVPKLNLLQKKAKNERNAEVKESKEIALKNETCQAVETSDATIEKRESKKLCLAGLPRLSKTSDEIVLVDEELTKPMLPPSGLDVFMQRLKRHAVAPKQKTSAKSKKEEIDLSITEDRGTPCITKKGIIDQAKIEKASDTPGSRHLELKKQLQKEMRVRREAHRKEAEIRHKLENEEFSEEEEEWENPEEESDEDKSDNEESGDEIREKKRKPRKLAKQENDFSDDEDDEELKKWNAEDERKQIETQMDDLDEIDQDYADAIKERQMHAKEYASFDENTATSARTVGSSLDLFPGIRHDEISESGDKISSSLNLELKESTEWDESNTIPPGQGDSFRVPNRFEANTPFSKLLKSGIFSTRRRSSASDDQISSKSHDQMFTVVSDESSMMPPIEDSQCLYKDDESHASANRTVDAAAVIDDDLHFTLDENTQFSQILDTQGYFNPGGKEKKKPKPQSLFDADDGTSVSELLGLCTGNFDNTPSKPRTSMIDDDFGLPSDLPCDKEEEDNSQEFLGFCSGKFATQACLDDNAEDSRPPAGISDLFDKQSNATESQLMNLCSGTFAKTINSQELNRSVFEDSKSTGSLMNHFKQSNSVTLEGRRSFDNLFGGTNTKKENCNVSESIERKDNDAVNDDENRKEKIFFIGSEEDSQQESKCDKSRVHTNKVEADDMVENECFEDEHVVDENQEKNEFENEVDDIFEDEAVNEEDVDEEDIDEEDVDEEDVDEEDVDEELQEYYQTLPKKKFSKKQFYEQEAELSGSDVGEDEDDDLGSEADEYEEESDVEDLPSRAKLQAQAHNAHMKMTLEDDKQNIRYIQERFYEDGDLLSDGNGRRRNFRWRNIDQPSQMDPAEADGSGDEAEEEQDLGSQQEVNKRIERLEREAFLEEQRKSQEDVILDENSQSILSIIKANYSESNDISKPNVQPIQATNFRRLGSFLERSKNTLSRLSSITSNGQKPNAPTRSFVFQAKPSNNTTENDDPSRKIRRSLSELESPAPKKAKFDRQLSNHTGQSIFKHF